MERFPDEACSPVGVGSRGEACFARRAWSPSEVHSPVEMQLADVVPQDGLLELRLAAFLGEERWSQVDCFWSGPLVVGHGREAARSAGGL